MPVPTSIRQTHLGAACGAVFIVLYFYSTATLLGPINQTDSLARAGKTFNDQADTFDVACALLVLSVPFLMLFVVTLYSVLVRSEGVGGPYSSLSLAAAAAGGAGLLAGSAVTGGVSFLAESATVGGSTAATAHSVSEALIFYSLTFFGVLALAVSLVTLRHGAFAPWFGRLAGVLGVLMIVGSAGSPIIRELAFVAGMAVLLFFVVGSVALARDPGEVRPRDRA